MVTGRCFHFLAPASPPPKSRATSSSGRWVAEKANSLQLPTCEMLQPLEGKEEVRPALGGDQRVDLVDDHRLDGAEDLPRLRGEQQIERLWRGDEDVGRRAQHLRPLAGRGVARADAHGGQVQVAALLRDACEGRAQVALHVDGEGLERRDVHHTTPGFFARWRSEHEAVDGRQKGCQRLAGAGGREQKGGLACEDCRPTEGLGARGAGKRRLEPATYGFMKSGAGWHRIRPSGV